MKTNKTISLDTNITVSPEYMELVKANKLSQLVNNLLKEALKIKDQSNNKEELLDQIEQANTLISLNKSKLESIEEEQRTIMANMEANKRWKCPVCKTVNHMSNIRCSDCLMKSRDDTATEVFYLDIKG
jgi:phage FluMu protein Com